MCKRHSASFLTHPASSPGPRHYPHEIPSPFKRPRLTSAPSTPARDRDTVDFYQACLKSVKRLEGTWNWLAQRYARPLEEDDIIDLRDARILKDHSVVCGLHTQISLGNFSRLDEPGNDTNSEVGGVHSKDKDNFDKIDLISREARVPSRFEMQLRRVKPHRDFDSEDDDDLKDFLEAERQIRKEFGPVDEREDLFQLHDDVEDESGDSEDEVMEILGPGEEESEHQDLSRTFTTRTREDSDSEDEYEDELGCWVHDESTAIYEVVRTPRILF